MTDPENSHSYQASCSWSGSTALGYEHYGRDHDGHCHPATANLRLSADAAFRGNPARLHPEQLVVLTASSCQLLSFLATAARARVDVCRYEDDATAVLAEQGGGGRLAGITLRPRISVVGRVSSERLDRLVQLAHQQCYIANTLDCEVAVEPTFEVRGKYAFGGGTLYAGSALARLAASPRIRVTGNEVRRVPVAASRAAEMFAQNFSVWRSDSTLGQPSHVLDDLANGLDRLRETGGSESITWTIRQLALSPAESLG